MPTPMLTNRICSECPPIKEEKEKMRWNIHPPAG